MEKKCYCYDLLNRPGFLTATSVTTYCGELCKLMVILICRSFCDVLCDLLTLVESWKKHIWYHFYLAKTFECASLNEALPFVCLCACDSERLCVCVWCVSDGPLATVPRRSLSDYWSVVPSITLATRDRTHHHTHHKSKHTHTHTHHEMCSAHFTLPLVSCLYKSFSYFPLHKNLSVLDIVQPQTQLSHLRAILILDTGRSKMSKMQNAKGREKPQRPSPAGQIFL